MLTCPHALLPYFRIRARRFASAANDPVPPYRAEAAKSGRSGCKSSRHTGDTPELPVEIEKGELRVGSIDMEAGVYGRYVVMCLLAS
jgi:hypothetical protein